MSPHPLLDVDQVPDLEPRLRTVGEVFSVFRALGTQDSGCVSHGVRLPDGTRWCVKEATTGPARRSLDRAWAFHRAVRHPVIVPHLHRIAVRDGRTATVMPWRAGEYRPGPFVPAADRLPGSRRFMAPEEWRRGAVIDIRTTVYVLGRTARLLLDAGDDERAFLGTAAQLTVIERATRADPGERFGGARELAAAWRAASEPWASGP
ncbi:serine/threonine protein kinase [Streptomyces sp. NPDC050287]|uniref:serine/threonine protein kinase n=1 Tax=Streptomyces sp. NPDC050287 TaxID=3365608 RepID=UPI0037AFA971